MDLPTNETYKNSGNLLGGLKKIADRNKKEKENKGINILLIVLVLVSLTLLNKNLRKKYMKFQMIAILILIVSLLFKKDKFAETSTNILGSYLFSNSSPKNIRVIINRSDNYENIDINRGESKIIKINEGDYFDNFGYIDDNGEFKGCTAILNDNCKFAMLFYGGTTNGKPDYIMSAVSLDALNAPDALSIEIVGGNLASGINTSCAVKSIGNSGGNSEITDVIIFNNRNTDFVLDKYRLDRYTGNYPVEKVVPNVSIIIKPGQSSSLENLYESTDYESGNGTTWLFGGDYYPLTQASRPGETLDDGTVIPEINFWMPDFELVNYTSNTLPGILFSDIKVIDNTEVFLFKNIYGFTMD